jgi:hypothetical protein
MTSKNKAALPVQAGTLGKTASNNCLYFNHKKALYQRLKSLFLRWIKAGIGILFYQNLISFSMACKLSQFWRVRHD